jgi:predicted acetyltransferase
MQSPPRSRVPGPEVRLVRAEELRPYVEALTTGFLDRPDVDKLASQLGSLWDLDRTWGAFDGDRVAGTFRSWPTELTLPGGGRLPAAAVSAVTVMPTYRRRGVLRAMVSAEHGAMRERGDVVSILYSSEYPIYGRFGYGPATKAATWTLDTHATQFKHELSGSIEIAPANQETRDTIRTVFDTHRLRQPGEIRRRDWSWDFDLNLREPVWDPPWKGFVALHRDVDRAVDGYARYRAEDKWERRQPRNPITVDELHAVNAEAYASLWQFLGEMDWVASVRAERRTVSEQLPWLLTNARAATVSDVGDALWLHILDLPRALAARTYERAANLVLEVIDPEAGGGRRRVHLDASPDGATCRDTDRSPDLTLDIAAISAAYLGATRLREAVLAGGVEEHRAGALAEADALLATLDEPWCSTFF